MIGVRCERPTSSQISHRGSFENILVCSALPRDFGWKLLMIRVVTRGKVLTKRMKYVEVMWECQGEDGSMRTES